MSFFVVGRMYLHVIKFYTTVQFKVTFPFNRMIWFYKSGLNSLLHLKHQHIFIDILYTNSRDQISVTHLITNYIKSDFIYVK